MSDETNSNESETTNPQSLSQALGISVSGMRPSKKFKYRQRLEMMAMYQWLEQNDPDFQDSLQSATQDFLAPRLVRKSGHHKKPHHHRYHGR